MINGAEGFLLGAFVALLSERLVPGIIKMDLGFLKWVRNGKN